MKCGRSAGFHTANIKMELFNSFENSKTSSKNEHRDEEPELI